MNRIDRVWAGAACSMHALRTQLGGPSDDDTRSMNLKYSHLSDPGGGRQQISAALTAYTPASIIAHLSVLLSPSILRKAYEYE